MMVENFYYFRKHCFMIHETKEFRNLIKIYDVVRMWQIVNDDKCIYMSHKP